MANSFQTEKQIVALANAVQHIELGSYIASCNVSEKVLPITNPKLWAKNKDMLQDYRLLACSLRRFQLMVESILERNR